MWPSTYCCSPRSGLARSKRQSTTTHRGSGRRGASSAAVISVVCMRRLRGNYRSVARGGAASRRGVAMAPLRGVGGAFRAVGSPDVSVARSAAPSLRAAGAPRPSCPRAGGAPLYLPLRAAGAPTERSEACVVPTGRRPASPSFLTRRRRADRAQRGLCRSYGPKARLTVVPTRRRRADRAQRGRVVPTGRRPASPSFLRAAGAPTERSEACVVPTGRRPASRGSYAPKARPL